MIKKSQPALIYIYINFSIIPNIYFRTIKLIAFKMPLPIRNIPNILTNSYLKNPFSQ